MAGYHHHHHRHQGVGRRGRVERDGRGGGYILNDFWRGSRPPPSLLYYCAWFQLVQYIRNWEWPGDETRTGRPVTCVQH